MNRSLGFQKRVAARVAAEMAWKTKIKSVALRPGPRPPWRRSDSKPQSPELAGIGPRSSLSQALRVLSLAGFIITVILSMAPISTDYRGSEVGCGSLFDQNMRMLCDPAITRRLWALLIIFAISLVVLYGSNETKDGPYGKPTSAGDRSSSTPLSRSQRTAAGEGRPSTSAREAGLRVAEELEKLANLRDRGVLSDEEFEAQKSKLLDG